MATTLNVRMSEVTKERGDAVLRRCRISASEAVRSLWEEMGRTGNVPDFVAKGSARSQEKERKKAALEALGSGGKTAYSHMTDEQLAQIYGARYE